VARLFGEQGQDHEAQVALVEEAPAAPAPTAVFESAFAPVAEEVMVVGKSVVESHIVSLFPIGFRYIVILDIS